MRKRRSNNLFDAKAAEDLSRKKACLYTYDECLQGRAWSYWCQEAREAGKSSMPDPRDTPPPHCINKARRDLTRDN